MEEGKKEGLPISRSMLKIKDLTGAIKGIEEKMKFRLRQKGGRTYASVHEAYGIIAEEHKELLDAIHENQGHDAIVEELNDIAVACIVAIASIRSGSVHW
jgi:NTP pyrophosphatase (non-canonical NTP hydrolase)